MKFTVSKKNLIIYGALFSVAIILGIIAGCYGEDAGIGLYVALAIAMLGLLPFAKRFVLWVGRKVVDFATTLDLVFVMTILYSGIYCKSMDTTMSDLVSYWWFVLGAFLYMLLAILMRYVLYILIDIRDSLKKIADGSSDSIEQVKEISTDTKRCPHCNAEIKATAKKCRYCGQWLTEDKGGN